MQLNYNYKKVKLNFECSVLSRIMHKKKQIVFSKAKSAGLQSYDIKYQLSATFGVLDQSQLPISLEENCLKVSELST